MATAFYDPWMIVLSTNDALFNKSLRCSRCLDDPMRLAAKNVDLGAELVHEG